MKRIKKGDPPQFFEDWKADFKNTHGRDPEYKDFKDKAKREFKDFLMCEQGSLCCYCMKHIELYDSHIEHFIPRALSRRAPNSVRARDVQLDYFNMFLSCNGETEGENHCGIFKGDEGSPMLLSPLDERVPHAFCYTPDGNIDCADPSAVPEAMTSIRALNLNTHALKVQRRLAIQYSGIFDTDFEEQKDYFLQMYSEKTKDGEFFPFCEAILYIMRNFS